LSGRGSGSPKPRVLPIGNGTQSAGTTQTCPELQTGLRTASKMAEVEPTPAPR